MCLWRQPSEQNATLPATMKMITFAAGPGPRSSPKEAYSTRRMPRRCASAPDLNPLTGVLRRYQTTRSKIKRRTIARDSELTKARLRSSRPSRTPPPCGWQRRSEAPDPLLRKKMVAEFGPKTKPRTRVRGFHIRRKGVGAGDRTRTGDPLLGKQSSSSSCDRALMPNRGQAPGAALRKSLNC